MNRATSALLIVFTLLAAHVAEGATMGPGPVGFDEAAAVYNPLTGEIIISVNDIESWSIRSASSSLTGTPAIFPTVPNAVQGHGPNVLGQGLFSGAFTYFDHNFGPIAAKGLPLSDLILNYSPNGGPIQDEPLTYSIPEPASLSMIFGCIVFFARFHRMPS